MGVGAGLYMCDVLKKVHVRYLISWWVLVIHMLDHYLNTLHPFGLHIISILFSKLKTSIVLILNVWQAWIILTRPIWIVLRLSGFRLLSDGPFLCYNLFHGICEIHLLPFKLGISVTRGNSVVNLLRPAAIQMLRNIFTQIELYLRGTVWVTLL